MTKEEATVGTLVQSNVVFCGVPEGSKGSIDEDYGTGVTVCWHPPVSTNGVTKAQCHEPYNANGDFFAKAAAKGFCRDGFGFDELHYLDRVKTSI